MVWTRVTFIHHHNNAILILIQNHSGNLKITCQRKSKAHLNEIRQIELIPKNVWAKTCRILWNSPTCLVLKSQCLVPSPWSDDSPDSAEHVCACQSLGKRSKIEPMGKLPRSGIFVNIVGAKERGYQCVEDFKFNAWLQGIAFIVWPNLFWHSTFPRTRASSLPKSFVRSAAEFIAFIGKQNAFVY